MVTIDSKPNLTTQVSPKQFNPETMISHSHFNRNDPEIIEVIAQYKETESDVMNIAEKMRADYSLVDTEDEQRLKIIRAGALTIGHGSQVIKGKPVMDKRGPNEVEMAPLWNVKDSELSAGPKVIIERTGSMGNYEWWFINQGEKSWNVMGKRIMTRMSTNISEITEKEYIELGDLKLKVAFTKDKSMAIVGLMSKNKQEDQHA